MDRLRTFSAAKAKAKSKMTPEQLKKQSTAKVRGLQHRHGELMKSLKDILSEHPDTTWETLKKDVLPVGSPDTALPETLPETGPATLWRPEGATSSRVKVMNLDGPAAKLNSRLRCYAKKCFVMWRLNLTTDSMDVKGVFCGLGSFRLTDLLYMAFC